MKKATALSPAASRTLSFEVGLPNQFSLCHSLTHNQTGGENIFPVEIEARLTDHDAITEAAVVAIKDERYGEVVGAFLREKPSCQRRPTFEEVNLWVRSGLGSHKAPRYIFWIGDAGVGDDFPKTGSGKYQKHILRAIGENLIKAQAQQAKKPERNVEVRARL